MPIDFTTVERTHESATAALLDARGPSAHWEGELSSSALSTATAACALSLLHRANPRASLQPEGDLSRFIDKGLDWIAEHQNADGGWGDTIDSPTNISTTTLCWAALGIEPSGAHRQESLDRATAWLLKDCGELTPRRMAATIRSRYGNDGTFSIPILTMCALAGRFGSAPDAWASIPALPFELAACPHQLFRRLRLNVVSYALPALIAVGQARHFHRPTRNPITRVLRNALRARTLRVLHSTQPESGGFLEAAPLTSFVLMSLASIGHAGHPVARSAAKFLTETVRPDGSWPIDTNLATWVTTLSCNALGDGLTSRLSGDQRGAILNWLVSQQHRIEHAYTHAAPGGWAWTDLSGGVPDGDDTPGALLALRALTSTQDVQTQAVVRVARAATLGLRWLIDVRNTDGGVPTFCRGWGKLPFDRSSPDLTAHAIRAWVAWTPFSDQALRGEIEAAIKRAKGYLLKTQQADGRWVPLWFGNQKEENQENPLYGTTRVMRAAGGESGDPRLDAAWTEAHGRATQWVLSAQHEDGGWGAAKDVTPSIEETALAVEALAERLSTQRTDVPSDAAKDGPALDDDRVTGAIARGSAWLARHTSHGTQFPAAPIGLYFAKLWYSERLYPLILTVSALERVRRLNHAGATVSTAAGKT